jgi:hypothetical protein
MQDRSSAPETLVLRRRTTVRRSIYLPLAAVVTSLVAAVATLSPAQAITNGEPDDGRHPQVALLTFQDGDGNALWRCSGTLVSPTLVVTAGHCTSNDEGGSVAQAQVWFAEGPIETDEAFLADVAEGDDPSCIVDGSDGRPHDGYPCTGEVSGTPYTHPDYDPNAFWRYDLGVVVLDEPLELPADFPFATLPDRGEYDSWRSNRKQSFTAVGYGLQKDFGQGAGWKDVAIKQRMVSRPRLISVNSPSVGDYSMRLSNNARTGGTCGGDSGGPNFLGDTLEIAAVTSYGMNAQTCSGVGGVYRLDGADDVAFLSRWYDYGPPSAPAATTLKKGKKG